MSITELQNGHFKLDRLNQATVRFISRLQFAHGMVKGELLNSFAILVPASSIPEINHTYSAQQLLSPCSDGPYFGSLPQPLGINVQEGFSRFVALYLSFSGNFWPCTEHSNLSPSLRLELVSAGTP